MRAGIDLSYLTQDNQEMIEAIVSENTFKVDMKKASSIREYEKAGKLNWDTAKSISKYVGNNHTPKDIESIIEKALELFFQNKR